MFHTIFYANNQFSLKLAVKLIEVILNYNLKDQNIQHGMMLDGISTILKIVLSRTSLISHCARVWRKLDESRVIDAAKAKAVNISVKYWYLQYTRYKVKLDPPFLSVWCRESHQTWLDLNASLRDLLELDHITQHPAKAELGPVFLSLSRWAQSHQREAKTAQTQTQWITGDNDQGLLRPGRG